MDIAFPDSLMDRLVKAGLTTEHVEALEALDPTQLQSVVERLPTLGPVFDAGALLGIGPAATDVPRGKPGVITVIVPGPISFNALADSEIGRASMSFKKNMAITPGDVPIDRGTYLVTLPNPNPANRWGGEARHRAVISAITLLCLHKAGFPDPLDGEWIHCLERNEANRPFELGWMSGRLYLWSS